MSDLMKKLTTIQQKQKWKDRALLNLVVRYIEECAIETPLVVEDVVAYVQAVADADNIRLQACVERTNNVN